MEKPQRSLYTPTDFLEWRESASLDLTPKFQRRGVWTSGARSFFIDTMLRLMPVPPIYIRVRQSDDRKRRVREIIDGQQRISCVLDFLDGKYRLSRTLAGPWAGKTFDLLTPKEQQRIETYTFSSELFHGISDPEVLQIFARLNTYSVPLNAQELRNGRYFGFFKESVYQLASAHLEFWRRHNIFSERRIARMLDVELTSELVIAQIDGMQDKKKSIDKLYQKYDEQYPERELNERRFRGVIDTVNECFSDTLRETEFSRAPLFYTLFCAIYHRQYELPNFKLKTSRKRLSRNERLSLVEAVQKLSDLIADVRQGVPLSGDAKALVNACLRQTDNIKPRQVRLTFLYKTAFGE